MNRQWCLAVWIILVMTVGGVSHGAQKKPDASGQRISIFYTGDIRGQINPKGCCVSIGGMARVITKLKLLKKQFPDHIVLDNGDFIITAKAGWLTRLNAKYMARAFESIRYDALNIADGELSAASGGLGFFQQDQRFSLTSLNVQWTDQTDVRPYIIKKVKHVNFAIVGLVSDHFFKNKAPPTVRILEPAAMLKKYLPEIRSQSDIIVLMSHMGLEKTRQLIDAFPEIDLVIVGHGDYPDFIPLDYKDTRIFKIASGGTAIGMIQMTLDDDCRIVDIESRLALLDNKVVPFQSGRLLEQDYNLEKRKQSDPEARKLQEEIEKAKAYLTLSPEEFIQQRQRDMESKRKLSK